MLQKIGRMYGERVADYVLTVLDEVEERNPSGRYPVRILWDPENQKEFSLQEAIERLLTRHIHGVKKK